MASALIAPPSVEKRSPPDPLSTPVVKPAHPYTHTLRVSYPSPSAALMVYNSVVVDDEIRSDRIYRHLRTEDNVIECYFSALELKFLRVSISSFLEMLAMATDTLAQFSLFAQAAPAPSGAAS